MKNIAVMTWYTYHNYGTALQAVAMSYIISKLGYQPFHIAYDPEPAQQQNNRMHKSVLRKVTGKAKRLLNAGPLISKDRDAAFNRFVSINLNLTKELSGAELAELSNQFDAFVCGSDQIWSPRCFDAHYYLDFVSDKTKKIAYAPSFGCESITNSAMASCIQSLIRDFANIAVREKSGADIVESLIGIRPQIVLDPTLLLSAEEWQNFSSPYPTNSREPYCLFYFLGDYAGNRRTAHKIAQARGLRVLEIPVFQWQTCHSNALGPEVGPAEFTSLVRNAALVCTDSFHGIVFSTIFNRPFIPFERFNPKGMNSQNTRIYNFLDVAGLKKILLTRAQLASWRDYVDLSIDFETVGYCVKVQREKSLRYLKNALTSATSA